MMPSRLWRDAVVALVLAVSTVLVAAHFAPIGSNAGFVDMGHDGYTLREAIDLEHGAKLFKDTYEQYGLLGPYLNLAGFELLGKRLLAIKYWICLWYGVIAILLYAITRRFLNPLLAAVSSLCWLGLAPFYEHGVMISVHVYVLAAQAAATLAILSFIGRRRLWMMAVAGFFCGVSAVLKQSVGFLFAVAVATYWLVRWIRGRSTFAGAFAELTMFGSACVAVLSVAFAFLWFKGSFHDWYLQTILFPRQFYLGGGSDESGPLWTFPMRFYLAHVREGVAYYWYLMRLILAVGTVVALGRGDDETGRRERLVCIGVLTALLWLAAYPSPHYMHQWWTISIGIGAVLYWLLEGARWMLDRQALDRSRAPALAITSMFLIVWPGVDHRLEEGVRRSYQQSSTVSEPWVVSGIRAEPDARNELLTLYMAIQRYRREHPNARLVSVDSSDGWHHGVAESLLWLSLLDDNPHPHPVYWSMPVLSDQTYPDYQSVLQREVRSERPLVGESRIGHLKPQQVDGYHLLLAIRTARNFWYLYAPTDSTSEQAALAVLDSHSMIRAREPYRPGRSGSGFTPQETEGMTLGRHEGRELYVWPQEIDPPESLPDKLEPVGRTPVLVNPIVRRADSVWQIDGVAQRPFEYLIDVPTGFHFSHEYFVARGELVEGGLTLGLQQGDHWAGYVNVTTPGKFAVLFEVARPGTYHVVLANCIEGISWYTPLLHPRKWWRGTLLKNRFELVSVGWDRR